MNVRALAEWKGRDPVTDVEWREAVDLAELWLLIESARMYGLIAGGPAVNEQRCQDVLARGAARGHHPQPVEDLVRMYLG